MGTKYQTYHLTTAKFHYKEREMAAKLKRKFGRLSKPEIECLSLAKKRHLTYFMDNSLLREICLENGISFMTLPMIMKALWAKKTLTKKQVGEIIERLEKTEMIRFDKRETIFGAN